MRVENMVSSNGNSVPNQFIINTEKGKYFQSYNSVIAFIPFKGKIELDSIFWDYSKTTGKYRNQFLGMNIKETREKINSGEIILTDLNGRGAV